MPFKIIKDDIKTNEFTITKEQFEKNKKLEMALFSEPIDFDLVENLLMDGADPLGSADESNPDSHIFGECLFCSQGEPGAGPTYLETMIPEITKVFLKHGMKIENNPGHPFDGNNINPVWQFGFCVNRSGCRALEMLLDGGLEAGLFEDFVDFVITDLQFCGGYWGEFEDNRLDADTEYKALWDMIFKMIFLGASFPYVIENSKFVKDCIGYDDNSYDLTRFRFIDDYEYRYDTSTAYALNGFAGTIVKVYEKASGLEVWRFKL